MSLKERLAAEMKDAMRTGDQLRLSVIRLLNAGIKNREIEKGKGSQLIDDEVIQLISSSIKQRRDSIEQFAKGGRSDLVAKEEKEVEILKRFLPEPLSEEELRTIVDSAISESGASSAKDIGKVMKAAMPKVRGRAEGEEVNRMVRQRLVEREQPGNS